MKDAFTPQTLQTPLPLGLTFLQGIFHDRRPLRQLLAASWPEERLNLPAGFFARAQALPHLPEEPHLLLQQRHNLRIFLLQHFWQAETDSGHGIWYGKMKRAFRLDVFLSPLISLALLSNCLLSSSVSLGIPSSSSFSLHRCKGA